MDGHRQTGTEDPAAARSQRFQRQVSAPAGTSESSTLDADAATLLLIAQVEGLGAESLSVEIYDPAGSLVATSVPAPGRSLATAVPREPGSYTVRVSNPGPVPVAYRLITERRFDR